MTDKKQVKFIITGIYPMVNKKEIECQCGNCTEPFTNTISLEVGNIIILINLCKKHTEYLTNMQLI